MIDILKAYTKGRHDGIENRHYTKACYFTGGELEAWLNGWRAGQVDYKASRARRAVDLTHVDAASWKALREFEIRGLVKP